MKTMSFALAVISFVLALVLAVFVHNMNARLDALAGAQGAGQTNLSADVAKLRSAADRLSESVKQQREDYAKLTAQTSQNSAALEAAKAEAGQNKAAIDDMKTRINRLIDLIK